MQCPWRTILENDALFSKQGIYSRVPPCGHSYPSGEEENGSPLQKRADFQNFSPSNAVSLSYTVSLSTVALYIYSISLYLYLERLYSFSLHRELDFMRNPIFGETPITQWAKQSLNIVNHSLYPDSKEFLRMYLNFAQTTESCRGKNCKKHLKRQCQWPAHLPD